MTSKSNRVGFGFDAFGSFKWGWGDWSEVMLWNFMPSIYRQEDAKRPNQELRGWIESIKPSFQDLRERLEFFFDLRDPLQVPESLIEELAGDFGLVDDKSNVEERRRAILFSVFQLYLNKGTEEGYRIIGAFTNVAVTVEGLWESPCGSSALQTSGPASFIVLFDEVPIDQVDNIFDDFFTTGGETALGLRFNNTTLGVSVSLLTVNEVKRITLDASSGTPVPVSELILTLTTDYTVNLVTGVVTLVAPASANEQYRVTYSANVPVDTVVLDEFALWPLSSQPAEDICRTSRLILNLSRIPGAISEAPASLDEIIEKIEAFKPAHVLFDRINYDITMPVSFAPTVTLETP